MSQLLFELVLPCYNESKNLSNLVQRAAEAATEGGYSSDQFQLVLVENGSQDNSLEVMDKLKKGSYGKWFRVVPVQVNQGYGFGIFSGLQTTQAQFVGWSHADQQCDPRDAFKALKIMLENSDQRILVKGDRQGRDKKDRIVSRIFEFFSNLILGGQFHEVNAQPKVFNKEFLTQIENPPKGFSFDLYVLYRAMKAGYSFKTLLVQFPSRIHGASNFSSNLFKRYKTILGAIAYMVKLLYKEGRLSRSLYMTPLFLMGFFLSFSFYFILDLLI